MDYLPSQKFIKTVGAAVAVILGGWLVLYSINRFGLPTKTATTQQEAQSIKAYNTISRDSDNDGLKDWEEIIWGTDQKNSDTDGDGTPDGQEVQDRRDPLKAGPDDLLAQKNPASPDIPAAPQTETESFGQNFNVRYFTTKGINEGLPLDTGQKQLLVDAAAQDVFDKLNDFKDTYAQNSVTVAINKKPRAYINEVGSVLYDNFKNFDVSEPDILKDIITSGNTKEISKLNVYIAAYSKTTAFLAGQSVPPDYAALHLELLNIENNFKTAVQEMKYLDTDPMRSAIGSLLYAQQIGRTVAFLKNLEVQFQKDNLTFSASEKGSIFYKYFTNYIQ